MGGVVTADPLELLRAEGAKWQEEWQADSQAPAEGELPWLGELDAAADAEAPLALLTP